MEASIETRPEGARDAAALDFAELMLGRGGPSPTGDNASGARMEGAGRKGGSGPSSRQGSLVNTNDFDFSQFRRKPSDDRGALRASHADGDPADAPRNPSVPSTSADTRGTRQTTASSSNPVQTGPNTSSGNRAQNSAIFSAKKLDFLSLMTNSRPPDSPMQGLTRTTSAQGSFVSAIHAPGASIDMSASGSQSYDRRASASRSYHQADRQMSDSALRAPANNRKMTASGSVSAHQSFTGTMYHSAQMQQQVPPLVQPPPSMPPPPQRAPPVDTSRFEQTISNLESELNEMFHQRSLAEDSAARAQSELMAAHRRLAEVEAQLSDSESRASAGKKALWELKSRLDEMERASASASVERSARFDAELAQARARVVELEGTTAALQREMGSLEVLAREGEKIAALTAQMEALEGVKAKNAASLEALQVELAGAQEAAQAAVTREKDASAALAEAEARIETMEKSLEAGKAEEKQVRDASAQMLYDLELKNDALANELENLRHDVAEKEREWAQVEEVQTRLKTVSAERDALLADQRNNEEFLADAEAREHALQQLVYELEAKVSDAGLVPDTRATVPADAAVPARAQGTVAGAAKTGGSSNIVGANPDASAAQQREGEVELNSESCISHESTPDGGAVLEPGASERSAEVEAESRVVGKGTEQNNHGPVPNGVGSSHGVLGVTEEEQNENGRQREQDHEREYRHPDNLDDVQVEETSHERRGRFQVVGHVVKFTLFRAVPVVALASIAGYAAVKGGHTASLQEFVGKLVSRANSGESGDEEDNPARKKNPQSPLQKDQVHDVKSAGAKSTGGSTSSSGTD